MPCVLYDSTRQEKKRARFTEEEARNAGNFEPNGYRLLEQLIAK